MGPDNSIPFLKIHAGEEEERALIEVARSKWWTAGEKTRQLEAAFGQYVGAKHTLFVSSATEALFLAYEALGLKNRTFKMPSLTFTATAAEVLHSGNHVEFIDVDRKTICATGRHAGPLVTVHYGGNRSDAQGDVTVEDSAHLIARDQCRGSRNLVCFSLAYSKNISAGEGGMIATNDDGVHQWLVRARSFGMERFGLLNSPEHPDWPYSVEFPGWKSNATDFQAALGLVQLPKLERVNERRRVIVDHYNREFGYRWHGVHLYPVFVEDRVRFLRGMKEALIQCSVHYIPLHWMNAYRTCARQDLPNTEWLGKHLVTIPLYPDLTDAEVERIVSTAKRLGPFIDP